jgi:hypothetical protein
MKSTPMSSAASRTFAVTVRSARDGVTSPLGWLCARMNPAALTGAATVSQRRQQERTAALGSSPDERGRPRR